MPLIWHYESTKKGRKLRNITAKQSTKKYGRKLLSEDEAFCIKGSYLFPLGSEQTKVYYAPLQWCLQNCGAFARIRLLGALEWEPAQQKAEGIRGLSKHPVLDPSHTKGCISLWSRAQAARNTLGLSFLQRFITHLPKAHEGCCSLLALCGRPCW